jgi:hypothetical protein
MTFGRPQIRDGMWLSRTVAKYLLRMRVDDLITRTARRVAGWPTVAIGVYCL